MEHDESTAVSAAIGWALTGQRLPDAPPGWAADDLAAWLADQGWDAARLRIHRDETRNDGEAWPTPVPAILRGGLGAAQFAAALSQVVAALELDPPILRDASTPPGVADQRLLADVPPHHGPVG